MALEFYTRGVSGPRTTATPTYPTGKFSTALGTVLASETGADTFLATPGSATRIGMVAGTVEAWVKPAGGGSTNIIFCHQEWYWLAYQADGGLVASIGEAGGAYSINVSPTNINNGDWHHIALVFDGTGTISIYYDGNRVGTSSATGTTGSTSTDRFVLGGLWTTSAFDAPVDFDELRISNVARYSGTTYTVPTTAFTSDANTVKLYHFNEGAPPEDIPVTATAPTRIDLPGTDSDTYTIPTTTGVEYRVGGVAKAAGTYPSEGATSVTVTYHALTGYVLTGPTSITLNWTTDVPPPANRYRLAFEPLVWTGTAYPERHPGAASVTYIGPSEPADWQPNDLWVDNS